LELEIILELLQRIPGERLSSDKLMNRLATTPLKKGVIQSVSLEGSVKSLKYQKYNLPKVISAKGGYLKTVDLSLI